MTWLDVEILAREQYGLFTAAQAVRRGVARAMLSRKTQQGTLEKIARGIYSLASAPYDEHQDIRARWMALEPEFTTNERHGQSGPVIAMESAAAIYGVGIFYPEKQEFFVPYRLQTRDNGVRIRCRRIDPEDVMWIEGLPLVSPTRLICDFLHEIYDLNALAEIIKDFAMDGYGLDWEEIGREIARVSFHYGLSPENLQEVLLEAVKGTVPPVVRSVPSNSLPERQEMYAHFGRGLERLVDIYRDSIHQGIHAELKGD